MSGLRAPKAGSNRDAQAKVIFSFYVFFSFLFKWSHFYIVFWGFRFASQLAMPALSRFSIGEGGIVNRHCSDVSLVVLAVGRPANRC